MPVLRIADLDQGDPLPELHLAASGDAAAGDRGLKPAPRLFGVDFSGAVDAGRKIWLASAEAKDDRLIVVDCRRTVDLPHGGVERDRALAALRRFISAQTDALFGLDFPFSLPQGRMSEPSWEVFVARFGAVYPDADSLFEAGREAGPPSKRQTDVETRTPFAPQNLRLFRQTYYGIRDVLSPLVLAGQACVLPMQTAERGRPWLVEICPASTLKRRGLYAPYKGRGDAQRRQRGQIIAALEGEGLVLTGGALYDTLLDDAEGDALDSVLAAFAAWTAVRVGSLLAPASPTERLEGRVFA